MNGPHHRAERRRGLPKGLISAYLTEQSKRKPLAPKLDTFEPPSRIKRPSKRQRVKP